MKAYSLLAIMLTIFFSSCAQYDQSKRHYYVGNHKFHQFQYGIHEDRGFPIGGTNKEGQAPSYRAQYKKDGSQREL